MKFFYIGIFYFLLTPFLYGQNTLLDWEKNIEDIPVEERDTLYYALFRENFLNGLYNEAIIYAEKAYNAAVATGDHVYESKSCYGQGRAYFFLKDYINAIKLYNEAKEIAYANELYERLIYIYSDLGSVYLERYEYSQAVENYIESLKYAELYNNKRYIVSAYNQLGLIDLNLGNYEEALRNLNSAIDIRLENNILEKINIVKSNIALCYNGLYKFKNAIEIYFEILNDYKLGKCKECDEKLLSSIYIELGSAYLSLNEPEEAKKYLHSAISINEEEVAARAYGYLSDLYYQEGIEDSALYYLSKSLEYALEKNDVKNIILNKQQFAKIYESNGNYAKALQLTNEANELKDSIFSADLGKRIRDAYVNLEKYKSNQVINRQDQTIQRSYNFLFMLGIILILVTIVLALTYRALTYRRRINKRLDQMVQQKTKELRDTNEELIRSRKELDSFLYRTSHDIRGPIATLMGLTKLARLEAQDNLMQNYLEKIEFTGNKLNTVISRLTNVSQINSQPLDLSDINIYLVINEVIDDLKLHRNEVSFKLTGDTSSKIKTDKILLKIILENLLDNSFKFYDAKEKNPYVELNIQQNGNLQFTITDNGVGIEPEYGERVFELFFVANEKERGTGIGLYQTQLAIKKLQGNVVLTENKKPTSFKVVIPTNGSEN